MKSLYTWFLLILAIFILQTTEAQKVLLLQHSGTRNRIFFKVGDKIKFRIGDPEFTVNGRITGIQDSILSIDGSYLYGIKKITEVIKLQKMAELGSNTAFVASAAYASVSIINHAINSEKPVIDNSILPVSGSLAVLGAISYLFKYKKLKMENGWHFKVLDYETYKVEE